MSQPRQSYTTAKGTVLPILNLRGKEYLEVKWRIVWFREDHPAWGIETILVEMKENHACACATIKDETGRIVAQAHKFEDRKGFPDFIEKAETGSIGRALALIGYGTQFCADELDEGKRIVDAPVAVSKEAIDEWIEPTSQNDPDDLGEFVITFGKHSGKTLRFVGWTDCNAYLTSLESLARAAGKPLSGAAKTFKHALVEWGGK